jgi:hypothetical protein
VHEQRACVCRVWRTFGARGCRGEDEEIGEEEVVQRSLGVLRGRSARIALQCKHVALSITHMRTHSELDSPVPQRSGCPLGSTCALAPPAAHRTAVCDGVSTQWNAFWRGRCWSESYLGALKSLDDVGYGVHLLSQLLAVVHADHDLVYLIERSRQALVVLVSDVGDADQLLLTATTTPERDVRPRVRAIKNGHKTKTRTRSSNGYLHSRCMGLIR